MVTFQSVYWFQINPNKNMSMSLHWRHTVHPSLAAAGVCKVSCSTDFVSSLNCSCSGPGPIYSYSLEAECWYVHLHFLSYLSLSTDQDGMQFYSNPVQLCWWLPHPWMLTVHCGAVWSEHDKGHTDMAQKCSAFGNSYFLIVILNQPHLQQHQSFMHGQENISLD